MRKIEDWARESEEQRLEIIVHKMYLEGYTGKEISKYLNQVATNYLAELGYSRNGREKR